MHFMLDENVPRAVAEILISHGHTAEFIRDYVPPGSVDPLVATVAEERNGILVSFDRDFQKIAPRIPQGHRIRFRKLSRVWMRCDEPVAAARINGAIELLQSEFSLAQSRSDTRLMMWISSSYIRIDR